jgi:hypothetical protein
MLFIDGEVSMGTLAASERVWIIGGVKDEVGNEGRLGFEVKLVATMSFPQVKESDSVEMDQILSFLVMCVTGLLKMTRSRIVFPENILWAEKASK